MGAIIFYLPPNVQVYGRVEGLEHYVEGLFGPKGPLNSRKLQERIPKLRWARNADPAEALKQKIDNLENVVEDSFGDPKV